MMIGDTFTFTYVSSLGTGIIDGEACSLAAGVRVGVGVRARVKVGVGVRVRG
jgi:hypothetical protein